MSTYHLSTHHSAFLGRLLCARHWAGSWDACTRNAAPWLLPGLTASHQPWTHPAGGGLGCWTCWVLARGAGGVCREQARAWQGPGPRECCPQAGRGWGEQGTCVWRQRLLAEPPTPAEVGCRVKQRASAKAPPCSCTGPSELRAGRGGKEGARVSEPEASPCSGEQGQPPSLCKHTAATQTHAATPSQAQRHTEGQPCNHTRARTHTHSHKYKGTLRHINTRCPPEHAQGRCGRTHPSALVPSLCQVSEYCARPGPWGGQGRSSTTLLGLVALLANANWEDAQGSAAPGRGRGLPGGTGRAPACQPLSLQARSLVGVVVEHRLPPTPPG